MTTVARPRRTATTKGSNPAKGPLIDAEPARQHIRNLMAGGVSIQRLSKAANVSHSVISGILYQVAGQPPAARIRQANADNILNVRAEHVICGRVDATGTRRRIQALMAIGWPQLHIGPHAGLHSHYVTELLRVDRVYGTTAHSVAAAYNHLWDLNPLHHGVHPVGHSRVRNQARNNGWAPPIAWEGINLDDPAAIPDWTGHCGTDRGWHVHKLTGVPTCPPCQQAHDQWFTDHAHLENKDRTRALFAARAAANDRGVTLAEDIRELLGRGYDRQQVCERLQITRDVLQATLTRHPEPAVGHDEEEEAA